MQLFKSKVLEPYTSEITGKKVYPVKIDIKSGLVGGKPIIFTTGDINTATLSVMLCDDVVKYDIKGKRIVANIVRPEGDKLSVQGKVVKDGFVEFNLGYSGISQVGLYSLDIECVWSDNHLTTPIFSYMVTSAINVDEEVQEDIKFPVLTELIQEVDTRLTELVGYREELTTATETNKIQDTRLNKLEYDNKVQDTYLNGLFNENKDGRLSINREGNTLKLEGSKEGIVEVESIEGNTLVNIVSSKRHQHTYNFTDNGDSTSTVDYTTNSQFLQKHVFNSFKTTQKYKDNTEYTLIFSILENTLQASSTNPIRFEGDFTGASFSLPTNTTGVVIRKFTTNSAKATLWGERVYLISLNTTITGGKLTMTNPIVLEGDYTTKPLPSYFEGMLSSFEEHKITEEDVREGTEIQDNLDKYKCNVKVVGKNLYSNVKLGKYYSNTGGFAIESDSSYSEDYIPVKTGDFIIGNHTSSQMQIIEYDYDKNFIQRVNQPPSKYTVPEGVYYVRISFFQLNTILSNKFQVEKGSVSTEYEPYYERNQVVYLNSPLLKGDKLVYKEDGLYHYHAREQFTLDENLSWNLDSNTLEKTNRFNVLKCLPKADLSTNIQVISTYQTSKDTTYNKDIENIQIINEGTVYIRIDKSKSTDVETLKTYLKQNPIPIIYGLKEPTYEKILDSKFIVDIPNNATLSVESIIPCVDIKASYTGNIPSVYEIEETGINNSLDIEVTQQAVDFLLMSTVSGFSINKKSKGGNNMGAYFASRILKGALDYREVVEKYPEFKEDIDFILKSEGREDLIKR